MNAAALYVFVCMVLSHKLWGVPYGDMLKDGFGLGEINVALIFSAYHFGYEIVKRAKKP